MRCVIEYSDFVSPRLTIREATTEDESDPDVMVVEVAEKFFKRCMTTLNDMASIQKELNRIQLEAMDKDERNYVENGSKP